MTKEVLQGATDTLSSHMSTELFLSTSNQCCFDPLPQAKLIYLVIEQDAMSSHFLLA